MKLKLKPLTTGEFAKICNVKKHTLFHYDMMGPSSDEQKKAAKAKGEYPFAEKSVALGL